MARMEWHLRIHLKRMYYCGVVVIEIWISCRFLSLLVPCVGGVRFEGGRGGWNTRKEVGKG